VKGERGVKVRRVQGGWGLAGWWAGKESWKQAESEEEEEEGGETEQQRQEEVERRPRMRELVKEGVIGRSGGQGCGRRHVHKLPQRQ
jgi:hypothetical protein